MSDSASKPAPDLRILAIVTGEYGKRESLKNEIADQIRPFKDVRFILPNTSQTPPP